MIEVNLAYEEEIFNIVKANPQRYGRMLRAKGSKNHKNPNREHLLKYIFERTSFLDGIENAYLSVRLLYLRSNVFDAPKCTIDEKPVTKFSLKYFPGVFGSLEDFLSKQTCCKDCANKLGQRSREIYFKENYGEDITNTFQLEKTKTEIRKTKTALHGDPNYCNKEKAIETNIARYGKAFYFQTDEFKKQFKETLLKNYNVETPIHSPEIRKKMQDTYFKRTGKYYSPQNPEIVSKMHWKYYYDGLRFDSSWEIAYYRHLKENGIEFQYQPVNVRYSYVSDGKTHFYYPDFLIDGIIYEIKGDHLIKYYADPAKQFNRPDYRAMQAKMQKCFELEKEGKLKFVSGNELKPICEHIAEVERMSFKNWARQFKVHKKAAT